MGLLRGAETLRQLIAGSLSLGMVAAYDTVNDGTIAIGVVYYLVFEYDYNRNTCVDPVSSAPPRNPHCSFTD